MKTVDIFRKLIGYITKSTTEKRFKSILTQHSMQNEEVKCLFPVQYRNTIPHIDFYKEHYDPDFVFIIEYYFFPVYDEWISEDVDLLQILHKEYNSNKYLVTIGIDQIMTAINPRVKGGRDIMLNILIASMRRKEKFYCVMDEYIVDGEFIEKEIKDRISNLGVEAIANLLLFLPLHLEDKTLDEVADNTGIIRWKNILIDQERIYLYIETQKDDPLQTITSNINNVVGYNNEYIMDSVRRIYECINILT